MSKLNFEYVPLTFISDKEEIKKQIRNTLILIYLFEKYNSPARLEKLIEGTQYGYNASGLQSGKNKFLRISDIHESKVNWETVPYCNCDDEETYLLKNDDILIARTGGTTGKSFKIDTPPKNSIYAGYLIRIRAKATVNPDYLYLFLHSFAYWSQIVNLNERNFRPKANAENLKSLILPDCPKAIQDEAVLISQGQKLKGYEDLYAEIETALSEYDKAQKVQNLLTDQLTQLENLNHAILQEAVQGKLVKQIPKDEPASELLKRTKAEKIKSGKKEQHLPPIKTEEIPFEIPESWVWCRLGEICEEIIDCPHSTPKYLSTETGYYGIDTNCIDNSGNIIRLRHLSKEGFEERIKRIVPCENDIVYAREGSIGLAAFIPASKNICLGQRVMLFRSSNGIIPSFLKMIVTEEKYKNRLLEKHRGMGAKHVNVKDIISSLIPLPPLSEQTRIVTEIEKQLDKTKQIKEHIIANQHATEQLLKALLHGAFQPRLAGEVDEKENVEFK